jgi:hypothetical protein
LFRQEFSVDSFLKAADRLPHRLGGCSCGQFNGEFRSANVGKYVRSS